MMSTRGRSAEVERVITRAQNEIGFRFRAAGTALYIDQTHHSAHHVLSLVGSHHPARQHISARLELDDCLGAVTASSEVGSSPILQYHSRAARSDRTVKARNRSGIGD